MKTKTRQKIQPLSREERKRMREQLRLVIPLSREERERTREQLRLALHRRGWRQFGPNWFERTDARGSYQVVLGPVMVHKAMNQCVFEGDPNRPGRGHRRPKNSKYPYWWVEVSEAWYSEVTVGEHNIIHGLRKISTPCHFN